VARTSGSEGDSNPSVVAPSGDENPAYEIEGLYEALGDHDPFGIRPNLSNTGDVITNRAS
jgi:hypothetical protein